VEQSCTQLPQPADVRPSSVPDHESPATRGSCRDDLAEAGGHGHGRADSTADISSRLTDTVNNRYVYSRLLPTEAFQSIDFQSELIDQFRLIFVDQKNCRIQLLVVVIFCKLRQNRTSDDDEPVRKLCSQRYKYNSVRLTLVLQVQFC